MHVCVDWTSAEWVLCIRSPGHIDGKEMRMHSLTKVEGLQWHRKCLYAAIDMLEWCLGATRTTQPIPVQFFGKS